MKENLFDIQKENEILIGDVNIKETEMVNRFNSQGQEINQLRQNYESTANLKDNLLKENHNLNEYKMNCLF